MGTITKELIRELIKEEQFSSTKEIMESVKNMFKDVLHDYVGTIRHPGSYTLDTRDASV